MKRVVIDLVEAWFPNKQCIEFPNEIWTQIITTSLETLWDSAYQQAGQIAACRLVCKRFSQKIVPEALLSVRAVSSFVIAHVSYKGCFITKSQPAGGLDPDCIQLVDHNLDNFKKLGHININGALYRLTNLTALQLQNETGPSTLQMYRMTSLRALSLPTYNLSYQFRLPDLASRLVELHVPTGGLAYLDPHTLSQMTGLRSLSVPGQTALSPLGLHSLTNLEQLNISGIALAPTPSQRLRSLKPLTQLTKLTMDGNGGKDSVSWAEANVARNLKSVQKLTVSPMVENHWGQRTSTVVQSQFPSYCQLK